MFAACSRPRSFLRYDAAIKNNVVVPRHIATPNQAK